MKYDLDFTGKVVLVTGGRSGIGQAVCEAFAQNGAKVGIMGRKPCDETLARIEAAGSEGIYIQGDVSVEADVKRAVDTVVETYGKLDAAVNNAGFDAHGGLLAEVTSESFDKHIGVDLNGVFYGMKYEIPELLKNGGGAIVNMSSVAGVIADPGISPYVAAKHGVVGLTRAAGVEYAKQHIMVNCVCPGFVATEMTQDWQDNPEKAALVASYNAQNRIAKPEELAGMVLFLCSHLATFCSGAVYMVDGGQTAH